MGDGDDGEVVIKFMFEEISVMTNHLLPFSNNLQVYRF